MDGTSLGTGVSIGVRRGRAREAGFDFGGAVLPEGATLVRSGSATRIDAAGLVTAAAANSARFDHHPATLVRRGLLIEPAATNLLVRSTALDDAAWGKDASAPTVAADAVTAPDGTSGADLVTMPAVAGSGSQSVLYHAALSLAATAHTLSGWFRGLAGGERLYLMFTPDGVSYARQQIELTTAWRRYAAVLTPGSGAQYVQIGVDLRDPAQSPTAAGQFAAWGLQLETGSQATSFVATAGTPSTRAADSVTLDWASRGIGDGPIQVRYTFDDETVQDVATTVGGGTAPVPATLNRRWLRRAEIL